MSDRDLSRRQFVLLAGTGLLGKNLGLAQPVKITARQVVERIKTNVGVPWQTETVDIFKVGDPDKAIQGIATTFMSTLDVLKRASAAGRNFIITHEPTFYNHLDITKGLLDDPIYLYKQEFIKKNDLVVWRFHDHWHARRPDGIFLGFNKAIGWQKYQVGDNDKLYHLPATTLEGVAKEIQTRLKSRSVRVVGDPQLPVTRVGHGFHTLPGSLPRLPDVDAMIIGEAREWEVIEYFRDTVASGQKKGLVLIAHEILEEAGMEECARWLRTFVSEVPIEFVPTREPYWRPAELRK